MTDNTPLLSVRNLKQHYPVRTGFFSRQGGTVKAVDGVSFDLYRGETLGLVGESGCGKSTTAEAILRLEEPTDGQVLYFGENGEADPDDVLQYSSRELKAFRREVQMVMQDPSASFDPRMTVGQSIAEFLLVQGMQDRVQRRRIVSDLLERVGLSSTDYDRFPHELSGGQKQRVGLARALVLNPKCVIADEPVSALDVSIQADILTLIDELQDEFGLTLVFISHDLSVVRQHCDRVAVMYLGRIVELGPTAQVFESPQHPYTEALLSSIPHPDPHAESTHIDLPGEVPSPDHPPPGCHFHPRCHRIIQPPEASMPQNIWRNIADLCIDMATASISAEAIRASVVTQKSDITAKEAVTKHQFTQQLRRDYDIPSPVEYAPLEDLIQESTEALFAGDQDLATQIVQQGFETPCRSRYPDSVEIDTGHVASCHLRGDTRTQ